MEEGKTLEKMQYDNVYILRELFAQVNPFILTGVELQLRGVGGWIGGREGWEGSEASAAVSDWLYTNPGML